jgi:hypothetical protein
MFTTPLAPTPAGMPSPSRPVSDPWQLWRPETPVERQLLTVAELTECRCPDLCDRDHANE